jgi:hypothetical protein
MPRYDRCYVRHECTPPPTLAKSWSPERNNKHLLIIVPMSTGAEHINLCTQIRGTYDSATVVYLYRRNSTHPTKGSRCLADALTNKSVQTTHTLLLQNCLKVRANNVTHKELIQPVG